MRIARVRLQRFRGFRDVVVHSQGHMLVVGEPRSGRTDLFTALCRVLDSRSTSARVNPLDIHRSEPEGGAPVLTEVEVTLLDLGEALEQLLDGHLEALHRESGEPADQANAAEAVLGVRLCYRARYDFDSDTGDHWVDWPAGGDPENGAYVRARRIEREALPFLAIRRERPLQVRAEGAFRALVSEADPDALDDALADLAVSIDVATSAFSAAGPVTGVLTEVLRAGAGGLLGLDEPSGVTFVPDDGSLAALLRALQPALALDYAGALPLALHGSTAAGVLAVSEAIVAASSSSGLVVAVDDFGDDLDGAAAEHLAVMLRRRAAQLWMTTRRPDVVRAFDPEEVLRLTRSHGDRRQHRLAGTTDRRERSARRHLLMQLQSAMTSRVVVLCEGPHDVEGYGALNSRLTRSQEAWAGRGLTSQAARLVSAPAENGGKDNMPRLARLAASMGFHVRAILDHDKPGGDDDLFDEMEGLCERIVILPERAAVERALVRGLSAERVRDALRWLVNEYGLSVDVDLLADEDLEEAAVRNLKMKGGLHEPWVDALDGGPAPPIAFAVLKQVCTNIPGRVVLPDQP